MMTTSGLNDSDGGNNNTSEIWDGTSLGRRNSRTAQHFGLPRIPVPAVSADALASHRTRLLFRAPSSSALDFDPSRRSGRWRRGRSIPDLTTPTESGLTEHRFCCPLTPQNNYNAKVIIMGGDNPATDTTEQSISATLGKPTLFEYRSAMRRAGSRGRPWFRLASRCKRHFCRTENSGGCRLGPG